MERQLIVVVHGVGVREAGGATGQLSAGLMAENVKDDPWRPHSTDDFLLHEAPAPEKGALLIPFPAHMRRFRRYDAKDENKVRQERLVADFYWGDISATGNGFVRLLVGLFKIVLGLSHAIRENAYEVFPGDGRLAINMRRIARTAPLMIHGPIAAITIVLVMGLLVVLALHGVNGNANAEDMPEWATLWVQGAIGLAFIGLGLFGLVKSNVYLRRHLMVWVAIIGLVTVLIALAEWVVPDVMQKIYLAVDQLYFGTECMYRTGCVITGRGFVVLGAVLMALMSFFWIIVILCALIVQWGTLAKRRFPKRIDVTPMVTQAIALMAVLWLVLMMGLWSMVLLGYKIGRALFNYHLPRGLSEDLVDGYLQFASPALVAAAILGLVGAYLHIRKRACMLKMADGDYLTRRDELAEQYRLIVGGALLAVLIVFLVAMIIYGAFVAFGCRFSDAQNCTNLQDLLREYVSVELLFVGIVVVLILWLGKAGLATAVAIATDVLVYLNDYSWRSRESSMGGAEQDQVSEKCTRTLVERASGMRKKETTNSQGYWLRERIQSRMKVLVDQLIEDHKPQHLVIVSHSQGTVIAIEAIATEGCEWRQKLGEGGTLRLVTMGSPYTHIYNTYFPSVFKAVNERPELGKRDETAPPLDCKAEKNGAKPGPVLDEWINIFRRDDFVGTHIDTMRRLGKRNDGWNWPREIAVGPRGHTNYWTDSAVFPLISKLVEPEMSNRKAGAAAAGTAGVGVLDDKTGADQFLAEVDDGVGQEGQ